MSRNANAIAINPAELGPFVHALAGASGGVIAVTMTMPLYTLSTKLQADKGANKSKSQVTDLLKRIYQSEGVSGYYAGLQSALFGNAVTNFIYFYAYEVVSRAVLGATNAKQLNALGSMLSGAMAGSVSAVCTNPIWVVNTRSTVEKSSKNGIAIMLGMIREDGPLALFKGIKPALILVSNPVIQYTVYERLQNILLNKSGTQALTPLAAAGVGVVSKLIATLCTYPYSTIKTRMHLQKGTVTKTNVWDMIKDVVRKDGIKGLYQGVVFKLVQVIFGSAFLFYFKQGLTLWAMKIVLFLRNYRFARQKVIHL